MGLASAGPFLIAPRLNFDDFKEMKVARFGGQVDYQGSTSVLDGCAIKSQNSRYTPDNVETRFGTLSTMARLLTEPADATGVDVLEVLGLVNPGYRAIAFDSIGDLLIEAPDGSGILAPLVPPYPLPLAARMHTSTGDNNMLMAFSDGRDGLCPPIMYRGQTQQTMPISQNPVGALWTEGLIYLVGDTFRSPDGRWWRCIVPATSASSATPPQLPYINGYFSIASGNPWVPATTFDAAGGSVWEEWTPACVQYLPAPITNTDLTGGTFLALLDIGAGGTIPGGKDVYVKVSYFTSGDSARSAAVMIPNTIPNHTLQLGTAQFQINPGGFAIIGGIMHPRWIAEMIMQPNLFTSPTLDVWVAAVNHGAAAPADSAYVKNQGNISAKLPITLSSVTQNLTNGVQGCPVIYHATASNLSNPVVFQGQGGTRYMIVLRKDANASLAPVDPDSPILVNLVGKLQITIVEIARDAQGNVSATVGDITGFAVGQTVLVQGCTGDTTFNGSFALLNILETLTPQGILKWKDASHLSAANDQTGSVVLQAGPPPIAFLPPGGSFDIQDIAAFTVAAPLTGAPDNQNAGPFFYISEAAPVKPFETVVTGMQGPTPINRIITSLQRFTGGGVNCVLPDITGISPGMTAIVQGQGDPDFNGAFEILSVAPGVGVAGTLAWQQSINATAGGPGGGGLPLIIQSGPLGQVQATVQDASGIAAGNVVNIINASPSAFNGPVVVSSVLGNVVSFPSPATGVGVVTSGSLLIVQQNLPTCAPAGISKITSVQMDSAGNVTATVDNLGGLANGQTVQIQGDDFAIRFPQNASNGWVELTGATLNPDGLSGVITWRNVNATGFQQTGTPAFVNPNPNNWTVSALPDLLINFDDSALSPAVDVTSQLASLIAPLATSDLYFVPSIRQTAYVDNQHYPACFVFSNTDDPGNIVGSSGDPNNPASAILAVQGADASRAICVREIKDGPIIGLKQKGGYQINPSDLPASEWNTMQRWKEYGPVCAELVALATDFIAFWDITTGPQIYTGGKLEWIGKELSDKGTLRRVNTSALTTGWAEVDEASYELKFGIPLDGATTPNYELVVNYQHGWGFPEVVNRYGKLIVPRESRKWSINPFSARCCKSVKRVLATQSGGLLTVPPNDPRINNRQLLYGLPGNFAPGAPLAVYKSQRIDGTVTFFYTGTVIGSLFSVTATGIPDPNDDLVNQPSLNGLFLASGTGYNEGGYNQGGYGGLNSGGTVVINGVTYNTISFSQNGPNVTAFGGELIPNQAGLLRIAMVVPDHYDDDGIGIDWQYQPWLFQAQPSVLRTGGYRAQVYGNGLMSITPVTENPNEVLSPRELLINSNQPVTFEKGLRLTREFISLVFTNKKTPGSWGGIQRLSLYANAMYGGSRSPKK